MDEQIPLYDLRSSLDEYPVGQFLVPIDEIARES